MNQQGEQTNTEQMFLETAKATKTNFDRELWYKTVKEQMLAVMRKKKAK